MADDVPGPSQNGNNNGDVAVDNNMNNLQNGTSTLDIFREICGLEEETAAQLLRESGGNLEAAIHQFFYTNENPRVAENQGNEEQELRQRRVAATVQAAVPNANVHQAHLVPQRAPVTWGQWVYAVAVFPLRYLYFTFTESFTLFYHFLFGQPNRRPAVVNQNRRAIPAQQQQQNVIQDRMLMRQQQAEYEEALAIDRQRAQERRQHLQQQREEEERVREEENRLQARSDRIRQRREVLASQMQPEPSPGEQGLVRIRVSFPNGVKVDRRFRAEDSLERLFEFIFVHADCPEDFSLLASYPPTLLQFAPDWYRREFGIPDGPEPVGTIADQGFGTSAVILVQDNQA